MPAAARLLAASLVLLSAAAALAEPVFPPGSRLGLTPPVNMELSRRFTGFENAGQGAAITLLEMPSEAYAELSKGLTDDALKSQGFTVTGRDALKLGSGDALLFSGEQAAGGATMRKWLLIAADPTVTAFVVAQTAPGAQTYTDEDIRAALTSLVVRPPVALEDQIGALPFRIGDRAGFRPVRVMAGNSVLLTDGPNDVMAGVEQPILVVAQSIGLAPPPAQREAFARSALASNQTLREFSVERSQGFRQKGADWHEIVARATDVASGEPVVVMQTIRFVPGGYLRVVGITRAAARDETLPRFRAVIDSLEVN